jgi:hypothetical protein
MLRALVDGLPADLPADLGNRHFAALLAAATPIAPYAAPALSVADLKRLAAQVRWTHEVAGITVTGITHDGLAVATDDRAKTLLYGAAQTMTASAKMTFVADGVAYELTGSEVKALAKAINAHVQATFAALASVLAAIEAGTVTTEAAVAAAFDEAMA